MGADEPLDAGTSQFFLFRLARGWNRFWFTPKDPTPLGFIRLVGGFMIFYIHLAYCYDLLRFQGPEAWIDKQMMQEFRYDAPVVPPPSGWEEAGPIPPQTAEEEQFMKTWGVNPRQAWVRGHNLWSIWYHVTTPAGIWAVHIAILVIMFCFAVGFCSRVTSVLTWLAMLSYIQRGYTSLFGMDTITNLVGLYLMIGPSGAAFSVDRLLARWWAARRARLNHEPAPVPAPPAPSVSAGLALRLLQVNLSMIYLVSGLSKLLGNAWWAGNATWLTMANYEFSPLGFRLYMEVLRASAKHRWLWELCIEPTTFATLAFEISFIFLIWRRRFRPILIIGAVLLHLGIAFFMGLVAFSIMMLVALLAFVPAPTIQRLFAWRRRGELPGLRLAQLPA
jgi:hypothetical protein